MAFLTIEKLVLQYGTPRGDLRAVDGATLVLEEKGGALALIGETGSGKSSLAMSVARILPGNVSRYEGRILLGGVDLMALSGEEYRRTVRWRRVSVVFQGSMNGFNPVMRIGRQIAEPLEVTEGESKRAAAAKARKLLESVGLPGRIAERYPHELSGGMKQRVMIAMALACRPGLLIADEPTTALDVTIQEQILALMRELRREFGTAVLLITHDLGVVAENADRVAVMYAGRIVEEGSLEQILRAPAHPYTVKLLASLPSAGKRHEALQTIEGRVPPPTRFPEGCRFAPRCHKAMEICREVDPELVYVGNGHRTACVLYDEGRLGRKASPEEVRAPSPPRHRDHGFAGAVPLVRVRGLKLWFPIRRGLFKKVVGQVRAVDGVDLEMRRGRTSALVGESGCGKTTLGKAVLQLLQPSGGSVEFDGTELTGRSRSALKPFRRRLQIIFQDPFSSLDPRMMIGDILTEGMAAHRMGRSRPERLARAKELMDRVGLDPQMVYRYPHEFSGGQRQRIAIARCLAVEPEFIVCDEATSALDVSVQAQIINLLKRLQEEMNLTYLFITHDLSVVEYLADEVCVMYLGRIVERGLSEEIFSSPRHPYTRALLSAVPRIDPDAGVKKIRLAGDTPSPAHPPAGCHFHPRCPEAMERCSGEYPRRFEFSGTHSACCWLYAGQGSGIGDQGSSGPR